MVKAVFDQVDNLSGWIEELLKNNTPLGFQKRTFPVDDTAQALPP